MVVKSDVVSQLEWRYATKKFDSTKKIDKETWNQIEEGLRLTPSSFGLQPWKFVVVTDQKTKEELVSVSMNQSQPADCSHLVVICRVEKLDKEYVEHYIDAIANTRGVTQDSLAGFRDMMVNFLAKKDAEQLQAWASAQCYIALGTLMSTASALHIDNCPMEGFAKNEYDRILKLEERGLRSVVLCALGFRAEDDKYAQAKKVRFPADEVIIHV